MNSKQEFYEACKIDFILCGHSFMSLAPLMVLFQFKVLQNTCLVRTHKQFICKALSTLDILAHNIAINITI